MSYMINPNVPCHYITAQVVVTIEIRPVCHPVEFIGKTRK